MRLLKLLTVSPYRTALLYLLLLLNAPWLSAAEINVAVDRSSVNLNESFQITFTATDSPDDDPDFTPLEQDFEILGQSQSTHSSWINGSSSKTIQWVLQVMAKHAGNLTVPAVQFGDDVSQPTTVQVTENATNKDVPANSDLFLEVEASPEGPYVQSQVLYTMRLYRRVEISQASLNEPELADAVIEKLGDDSNYSTQINGEDYWVTERKYAIFPQKSGRMTIKPLALTAQVVTATRPSFGGFFNSRMTKTQRVASQSITLDVKPAASSFTAQHWLPAEQLHLNQEWSGDIEHMKVGEPLTRTLTLLAKGATVSQLPELSSAKTQDQLKSYPDQPVLKEQKKSDGVIAFREEKIALIPSKEGSYKLPAIEVPWFNTKTQQMEVARIPETTIYAVAAAGTQAAAPVPAKAPVETAPKPETVEPALVGQTQQGNIWLGVSGFLAVGWLATLVYFLSRRPVEKPVPPAATTDVNVNDSIKKLKQACSDNDAVAAKDALLDWGRQKFVATNLGAIASSCDARLRDEILLLNQALYGRDAGQWQGKRLFQAFSENKARERITQAADSGLEPLYRL
ncbi:BatD family protein [Methylobacter sp. YRD-M1]|uniref:BatD family protein n=1 Tax=Methylobacter sp. YRD-M1 TaxID=2911520 RepID=UPI00227B9741|nr:BatD family protein [Methylobacter sp. YRD-M1]WAK02180.1 BatD family protein [Methylobacter sp. YRD-M1]